MAVYTEVPDNELALFIDSYGLGKVVSASGIAEGVENTNYLVVTEHGRFILTLYEKRVAAADLPFFLGLMEHLAAKGLSCPTPLRDLAGRNLHELAGRPAALVSFLAGTGLRSPTPQACQRVGMALAQLHAAGSDFTRRRANALGPSGWRPLFRRFEQRAEEVQPGLTAIVAHELDEVLARWPTVLPSGVIHADLFPDNVFFQDDRLTGLIDFYFACNDQLAYDIAVCLNAWCFDNNLTFDIAKGGALLAGYQSVRPLLGPERDALPILARGAALRFLLTRAHDWVHTPPDAMVVKHDPIAYLNRLRFHQTVTDAGAYGLDGTS